MYTIHVYITLCHTHNVQCIIDMYMFLCIYTNELWYICTYSKLHVMVKVVYMHAHFVQDTLARLEY